MDISTTLKTVLQRATSKVWSRVAPGAPTLPYIVFKRIAATERITFAGLSGLCRDRFQVICVASTEADCSTLVSAVEAQLALNQTDFEVVFPINNKTDYMEDSSYASRQDWYIIYKK